MSKQGWFARNRQRYPADWVDIANAVKTAAGWQCEACGSPSVPGRILTVHHLNHDVENRDAALIALCQVCHLRLGPHIYTKDEAIARLRRRAALDGAQQEMVL
jgi:5-methylcytosine-specific restriction endonuclease McrA